MLFFNELVPLFFMISGYLMCRKISRRENPMAYVKSYLMKYLLIYYAVLCIAGLYNYLGYFSQSGVFMWKSLIVEIVLDPWYNSINGQLWFIPPLLLGIFVCSFCYVHHKEKALGVAIAAVTAIFIPIFAYSDTISLLLGTEAFYQNKSVLDIMGFISRMLCGVLYTYLGMFVWDKKITILHLMQPWKLCLMVCFTIAEAWLIYHYPEHLTTNTALCFSVILWSVFVFLCILEVKNKWIYEYHVPVNIFSGLTFFLHMLEFSLLGKLVDNRVIVFAITTIINAVITWWIYRMIKKQNVH